MKTTHQIYFKDSKNMQELENKTVDLMITSPPYPMIEMWDEIFSLQNSSIRDALENLDGNLAFNLMHLELDKVWSEVARVLVPGGIACVNIGDATRTMNKVFRLYSSHSKILDSFHKIGLQSLPGIIWQKPTNAPNKFMGSGMLPPSAYVTLEHEHILIFRKGNKREYKNKTSKRNRQESSYFWEERNQWFSDIWDLKGVNQYLRGNGNGRKRSAAFPFELAYRLINMYSTKGEVVLDPFLGTGTTTLASMCASRSSIGYEIDQNLESAIDSKLQMVVELGKKIIKDRLSNHRKFIKEREKSKVIKHYNLNYEFPVVTSQEQTLFLNYPKKLTKDVDGKYCVIYEDRKQ